MDAQKDIILPNALATLQQSATGLPIFTLSVHSQQYTRSGKKSWEGLVSFVMSVVMRLMVGERSPY